MARRYVLIDDFDGKELPEDTSPISLTLGRTTYSLYLGEKNYGKLLEALEPFIKDAETVDGRSSGTARSASKPSASSTSAADKEYNRKVRAWAQSTGFKYTDASGEEKTLGDRGRIPEEVVTAYEEANN